MPVSNEHSKPWYRQLYFQVLTAIVIGVLVGFFFPSVGASLKPLGDAGEHRRHRGGALGVGPFRTGHPQPARFACRIPTRSP